MMPDRSRHQKSLAVPFAVLFIVTTAWVHADTRQRPVSGLTMPDSAMPESPDRFASATEPRPFEIAISEAELADLQRRLGATRWPDASPGEEWAYGTDLEYLQELVAYWQTGFDWRAQESRLNQLDHFKIDVQGIDLHYIHERSAEESAIPLMIVHGWPGSVAEFTEIIGPLTDPAVHGGSPADAFHIVAPSLPGFGFSGKPDEPGYSPERIALLLAELMASLGYERYAIAGGDWGAIINRHLANHYPERLIGMHSNFILAAEPASGAEAATPAELDARAERAAYMRNETAYQQIQGTKPQTLGYGLNDSPAGLAAWIVEKFHGWTDMPQGPDGDLDDYFHKDTLLTNISIYWFTGTITSSARIYYENRNAQPLKPMGYIDVPTGAAVFPAEIYLTPRAWAEAAYDIRHWSVMPRGGHFAALEQPELYVNDVREFFRLLR